METARLLQKLRNAGTNDSNSLCEQIFKFEAKTNKLNKRGTKMFTTSN